MNFFSSTLFIDVFLLLTLLHKNLKLKSSFAIENRRRKRFRSRENVHQHKINRNGKTHSGRRGSWMCWWQLSGSCGRWNFPTTWIFHRLSMCIREMRKFSSIFRVVEFFFPSHATFHTTFHGRIWSTQKGQKRNLHHTCVNKHVSWADESLILRTIHDRCSIVFELCNDVKSFRLPKKCNGFYDNKLFCRGNRLMAFD